MINQSKTVYVFKTFFYKYVVFYIAPKDDIEMVGYWACKRDRFFNISSVLNPVSDEWVKIEFGLGMTFTTKTEAVMAIMNKEFSL